jgi:TonB family protein
MKTFGLLFGIGLILVALPSQTTEGQEAPELYVVHAESPFYDPLNWTINRSGDVVVAVTVSEDGSVQDAQASGHPLLITGALQNVKTWRFVPGQKRHLNVTYEYRLDEPPADKLLQPRVTFDFPNKVRIVTARRRLDHIKDE